MTRTEWKRAWRFVRENWGWICQGEMWDRLTAQQLLAAGQRLQRELSAIATRHSNRVAF